jgi:hypothetical protein
LLTRGSHRSGRAALSHPVPQATPWQSPERYPPSLRERVIEAQSLQHVSLRRCCYLVRPFARPGPRGREFPGFDGTMEHYDFLPPVSPHSVSFARQYLGAARSQRSRRPASGSPGEPEVGDPVSSSGKVRGDGRISYVPGQPWCLCPALRPRWTRRIRPVAMRRCGPRCGQDEGVHIGSFEAPSHGFSTRCLRFAGRVTPPPRKTRFRPLARRYRTGLLTRRAATKGFRNHVMSFRPPSPSLVAQGQPSPQRQNRLPPQKWMALDCAKSAGLAPSRLSCFRSAVLDGGCSPPPSALCRWSARWSASNRAKMNASPHPPRADGA